MKPDATPIIGTAGTIAALTIGEAQALVGIVVGLATLVYVVSKTILLWRNLPPDEDV